MRTRATARFRVVAALVAALALAAAPVAHADDTAPARKSSVQPIPILALSVILAVTLTVLIVALRSPAADTSRLGAITGALDEALARGHGGRPLAPVANDIRWLDSLHRLPRATNRAALSDRLRLALAPRPTGLAAAETR